MAPLSDEGRSMMEHAIAEAWQLRMNQYAYDNGLIDKETYTKMMTNIKTDYAMYYPTHRTLQTKDI